MDSLIDWMDGWMNGQIGLFRPLMDFRPKYFPYLPTFQKWKLVYQITNQSLCLSV
jgi:hypothetical protein